MCDGPHFFRGVITRPAVFLLAGRKWEPDIRYRHILLGDFFSSSFHPPQQSLRSYIFRVNETLFFSIVAPTIFGRIIFFSTPMNYISFFFQSSPLGSVATPSSRLRLQRAAAALLRRRRRQSILTTKKLSQSGIRGRSKSPDGATCTIWATRSTTGAVAAVRLIAAGPSERLTDGESG